ncbi:unnamed protein product [Sphenostylis stenocarpa]|uniref:Uncharacterized protein n=1 Tax=Sphenostylis stenocarpa TaxID=92480 RepID=A0AA86S5Z8_9FABA|nr:unnamed protein product [Sphenostylis stenocarpa]
MNVVTYIGSMVGPMNEGGEEVAWDTEPNFSEGVSAIIPFHPKMLFNLTLGRPKNLSADNN